MFPTLADGTDLNMWANRLDARAMLPRLVRLLIHATTAHAVEVTFPADEAVQLGGYDGIVRIAEGNPYVPAGPSVWELGANADIKGKAESDYAKRTASPLGYEPSETTFVFVTPRRWGGKETWLAEKRAEGKWRDVRAIDGDDLAAWLELAPGVHLWISRHVGKHPVGASDIVGFWEEWSRATRPETSADLVVASRDQQVQAITEWLSGEPSLLALHGESREAGAAFFAAMLQRTNSEVEVRQIARGVVVRDADAWRTLIASRSPLVLIPLFDDLNIVGAAVCRGHHVLLPLGRDTNPSKDSIVLPPPRRALLRAALVEMGTPENRVDDMAKLGRHSLTALRRRLAWDRAILRPAWSAPTEARSLLPALLAGQWDDTNEADRAAVAELAGRLYAEVADVLVRWSHEPDPPVRRVGSRWMLVGRDDAWSLLSRFLTRDDLQRLEATVLDVLGRSDPQYELPLRERAYAAVMGRVPTHSGAIRDGLAETLAVMATFSDTSPLDDTASGQDWADRIVRRLFADASDWRMWASLSWLLPLLAEASPDAYLEAVGRGLAGDSPILADLFVDGEDDFGTFGDSPHTGLLWSLEQLAWSPDHLGSAATALATLARLDPGGRLGNRPRGSLHEIFLPWHPSTGTPLERRLRVLDRIRRSERDVAWKLLIGLLPQDRGIAHSTSRPRWRDWAAAPISVTTGEYHWAVTEIAERLLDDVGTDGARWRELIEHADNLSPDAFDVFIARLNAIEPEALPPGDRKAIWDSLRALLSRHTAFSGARWAMPPERVEQLKRVYPRFEPADPVTKRDWLFANQPNLIGPRGNDWQAREAAVREARSEAVRELYTEGGMPLVRELASRLEHPVFVGDILGREGIVTDGEDEFLTEALAAEGKPLRAMAPHGRDGCRPRQKLAAEGKPLRAMALGYLNGRVASGGQAWLEGKMASALIAEGPPQLRADFYCYLPFEGRTWDRLDSVDAETRRRYWSQVGVYGHGNLEGADHERIVAKLVEYGRVADAIDFISLYARDGVAAVPAPVIVDVLDRATREVDFKQVNFSSMTYAVGTLLDALDRSDGVDASRLAALEWFFLPLLRHQRPSRTLHRALAAEPEFFHDLLRTAYRAKGEEPPELSEEERYRVEAAHELLDSWHTLPGRREDSSLDGDALQAWTMQARTLAHESGRAASGDQLIGRVLASSPIGKDGTWPHEAIRDLIEALGSEHIETGMYLGVYNSRGVTSRALGEGGEQERALVAKYRGYAQALVDEWPRTARVLGRLADSYEREARGHDVRAELEEDL